MSHQRSMGSARSECLALCWSRCQNPKQAVSSGTGSTASRDAAARIDVASATEVATAVSRAEPLACRTERSIQPLPQARRYVMPSSVASRNAEAVGGSRVADERTRASLMVRATGNRRDENASSTAASMTSSGLYASKWTTNGRGVVASIDKALVAPCRGSWRSSHARFDRISSVADASARACRLVDRDELVDGRGADHVGDEVEGEVVDGTEAYARLAHVEPLPGLAVAVLERRPMIGVGVHGGEVQRAVALLRRERGVHERLAVVRVRVAAERDVVGDHAPGHLLDVAVREVGDDDLAYRARDRPPIGLELGQVLLDGGCLGPCHRRSVSRSHRQPFATERLAWSR